MCTKCLRVSPARMEFSPFFYQRAKREVKEILFWSREKHLAASWWEGERSRGGECKEDKSVRERWFISRTIYGFFFFLFSFFLESANHARHAERDDCCAPSAELDFKVNLYLSHGRNIKKKRGFALEKPTLCACVCVYGPVCLCVYVRTCACVGTELFPGMVFALSKEVGFQERGSSENLVKRFRGDAFKVAFTAGCYMTVELSITWTKSSSWLWERTWRVMISWFILSVFFIVCTVRISRPWLLMWPPNAKNQSVVNVKLNYEWQNINLSNRLFQVTLSLSICVHLNYFTTLQYVFP